MTHHDATRDYVQRVTSDRAPYCVPFFFVSSKDLLGQQVATVPASQPMQDLRNFATKPSCTIECDTLYRNHKMVRTVTDMVCNVDVIQFKEESSKIRSYPTYLDLMIR